MDTHRAAGIRRGWWNLPASCPHPPTSWTLGPPAQPPRGKELGPHLLSSLGVTARRASVSPLDTSLRHQRGVSVREARLCSQLQTYCKNPLLCLYPCVHNSTCYEYTTAEKQRQLNVHRPDKHKQNVLHPHSALCSTLKREENPDAGCNLDEPGERDAQ